MSSEVATGVNILKNGQDPPLRKDDELPAWLWELMTPDKTLAELQRADFNELTFEEVRVASRRELPRRHGRGESGERRPTARRGLRAFGPCRSFRGEGGAEYEV